ncbi:unnamed protein product [Toxocara canis]|uniref:Uncharacterized protein n=1 Tax=Toxocara canis TaxID=6265 RepID=A0A183U0J3_TOXCA|nr:unnamed protein product [Toxocara canis]
MNTCGNNLLTGRPSTSLPGSPSKANESSPNPLPRCYSMDKQQKSSLKRPYSDMTVLRSLCNDTDTPDATSMVKKRARDDENEQDRRLLAAEGLYAMAISRKMMTTISLKENHSQNRYQSDDILAAASQHFTNKVNANSCDESLSQPIGIITPTTSSGVTHVPSGDPNSPNRHHPLNHRPPAMEARFLECMAAIALHSNFSLPISTPSDEKEDDSNESQSSDTEKPPSNGEATIETEVETQPPAQPEACATNENEDVVVTCDASDVQEEEDDIVPQEDSKPDHADRTDDLTERLMHKSERKTWPTTAIDEELCKELENYKGTDVPMIHAYVIPSRSDTSSASGDTPDERGESPPFHSVPSLAVPVPILNILLERILHTMLQT